LVASAAPKNAADVAAHNDATTSREAVSLASSSLTEVPSSVLVASLRSLDLSHNLLISLPAALTGLRGLESLDVRHNRLGVEVVLGDGRVSDWAVQESDWRVCDVFWCNARGGNGGRIMCGIVSCGHAECEWTVHSIGVRCDLYRYLCGRCQ
jgi:hypothetical protein